MKFLIIDEIFCLFNQRIPILYHQFTVGYLNSWSCKFEIKLLRLKKKMRCFEQSHDVSKKGTMLLLNDNTVFKKIIKLFISYWTEGVVIVNNLKK